MFAVSSRCKDLWFGTDGCTKDTLGSVELWIFYFFFFIIIIFFTFYRLNYFQLIMQVNGRLFVN